MLEKGKQNININSITNTNNNTNNNINTNTYTIYKTNNNTNTINRTSINPRLNFVLNLIKEKLYNRLNRLELRNKEEINDLSIIKKEFEKMESKEINKFIIIYYNLIFIISKDYNK
jgi:hypothetical protein